MGCAADGAKGKRWWRIARRFPRFPCLFKTNAGAGGGSAPDGLKAPSEKPLYRPDIDGLRAIAVLAVLAFHAFPDQIGGGFIGVDVFFVISGFLISLILLGQFRAGEWSLVGFYSRRIRRIFPALLIVLVACFVLGWLLLLPTEFEQLSSHIAAAAAFIPNIMLWREAGYFDTSGQTKPLLHLWSLGIEEQFYLVWPLALSVALRLGRTPLPLMAILAGVSFALNVAGIQSDAVATFYSPQTRAWELLAGSIVAWFFVRAVPESGAATASPTSERFGGAAGGAKYVARPALCSFVSQVGACLLLFGFWGISAESRFPGLWAVVPVLGGVFIIAAGPQAWVNRTILSNPLLVGIGLISYPLYLWHWPLLSFAKIIEGEVLPVGFRFAVLSLSVALAWMTYRLVECPIRFSWRNQPIAPTLVALMASIGIAGYSGYLGKGLPFRLASERYRGDVGHTDYHAYLAESYVTCTPAKIAEKALSWGSLVRCVQSRPGQVDVALVGDSHAEHLFLGLANHTPEKNIAFYIKNAPAFIGNEEFVEIFNEVLTNPSIRDVVIAMHWFGRVGQVPAGSTLDEELVKVVDSLTAAGKRVYVVGDDIPLFPYPAEKCKWRRWWLANDVSCRMTAKEAEHGAAGYAAPLQVFRSRRPNIRILEVGKYLCNGNVCSMTSGDEILYRDEHHLNLAGSEYVGRRLLEDNPDMFRP